ncbi:hypothetical protein K7I13_12145 [Brucepastera parasyntrophica]|uniref:phage tail tube protein n=1 Tax=Brucepastera parasyntrophica TaxID=2880008 RepID=UPI0021098C95|nr:phage tail tube protein [Brucepastera parasyntrophica]ULQ59236.1 hypothetical protein K7I13_12145 [Brucepastera parasyntrophica]
MVTGNSLIVQVANETQYAVPVSAMTRQIKVASESLKPIYNKIDEGLLTGGKATGKVETMSVKAEGSISTIARPDDLGFWLLHLLGVEEDVVDVGDEDGTAKKHTFHAIGTQETDHLPSFTAMLNRIIEKFAYTGCKANTISFSAVQEDYLKIDITIVGKDEIEWTVSTTLVPSSLRAFKFRHGKVYLNGAEIADVTSIKFDYNNNLDTTVQTTSTGLYFKEPECGARDITTELEVLYASPAEATRKNYYKTDDVFALVLAFTSDEVVEDGVPYSLTITIPHNQMSDATANVSGSETLKQTMNMKAVEDGGTNS